MTILMEQQVWEKISLVTTVDQSINLSLPSSSQRARHGPSHEIYLLTEVQHKRRRMLLLLCKNGGYVYKIIRIIHNVRA